MAGGSRLCMYFRNECSIASHNCSRELVEELPGRKEGFWVVMAAPSPRLPLSVFFKPVLSETISDKV